MIENRSEESKALLLLNLGTPASPTEKDVRTYLKEFLMDPYVLDVPYLLRWFIVHGTILPSRPAVSAEAYRKVWTDKGSPLLIHLNDLKQKVQNQLGSQWNVQAAMRYGNPSIADALEGFRDSHFSEITLLPLYPQYSLAATESSIRACTTLAAKVLPGVKLNVIESFYSFDPFIESFAEVIRKSLDGFSYEHLLFSFHGLPERQIKKTDPSGKFCLMESDCCTRAVSPNRHCYRSQCFTTARLIAKKLNLSEDRFTICFQSRLGKTPWIQPFTDRFYRELPKKGIKKLAVACPAFVADCLETLEEVQIRGRDEFIQNGGEELRLATSLNSSEAWVKAVSELVRR